MKLGKKLMKMSLLVAMVALCAGCGKQQAQETKVFNVGIVQLMEHQALEETRQGFVAGLASRGYEEGKNIHYDVQNAQGDQSNLQTIAQRFLHEDDDLIAAIATPSAQTMAKATKKIPIVGMAITNFTAAKLVQSDEKPGGNVTGVSNAMPAAEHMDLIQALLPQVKTIGIMYTASEVNAAVQVEAFENVAKGRGIAVRTVSVSSVNDIRQVTESLIQAGVDAIWIPTDNVIASAYPNVFSLTNPAKIPVFPSEQNALAAGAVAMVSINYYDLGFQGGLMAADILEGKSRPKTMPIEKPSHFNLFVNETAVKTLGITVPAALREKAKMVTP